MRTSFGITYRMNGPVGAGLMLAVLGLLLAACGGTPPRVPAGSGPPSPGTAVAPVEVVDADPALPPGPDNPEPGQAIADFVPGFRDTGEGDDRVLTLDVLAGEERLRFTAEVNDAVGWVAIDTELPRAGEDLRCTHSAFRDEFRGAFRRWKAFEPLGEATRARVLIDLLAEWLVSREPDSRVRIAICGLPTESTLEVAAADQLEAFTTALVAARGEEARLDDSQPHVIRYPEVRLPGAYQVMTEASQGELKVTFNYRPYRDEDLVLVQMQGPRTSEQMDSREDCEIAIRGVAVPAPLRFGGGNNDGPEGTWDTWSTSTPELLGAIASARRPTVQSCLGTLRITPAFREAIGSMIESYEALGLESP